MIKFLIGIYLIKHLTIFYQMINSLNNMQINNNYNTSKVSPLLSTIDMERTHIHLFGQYQHNLKQKHW